MTKKQNASPINDAAAMCFRKALTPVTEDNLKADSDLVLEMLDRKIRVQDLLAFIHEQKLLTGAECELADWYMRDKLTSNNPVKTSKIDVSWKALCPSGCDYFLSDECDKGASLCGHGELEKADEKTP